MCYHLLVIIKKGMILMSKEEKNRIKELLRLWGNCDKNLRMQRLSEEELEKMQTSLERETEGRVIPIELLQRRMERLKKNAAYHMSVQNRIEEIVSRMPYDMQVILRTRYVKGMGWEWLPVHLPFAISLRQCYRIHNKALEIISAELMAREEEHPMSV